MNHEKREEVQTSTPTPDDALRITRHRVSTAVVVSVAGEIDLGTVEQLATAVRAGLAEHPLAVVVDLTGVQFMGSVGLAVLAEATQTASARGQALGVVVRDQHAVFRSLVISGMADHLSVYHHLDDAIAAR